MRLRFLIFPLLTMALPAAGQQAASNPPALAGGTPSSTPAPLIRAEDRKVSPKLFIPNVLQDQKRIWTFPVDVGRGEHVKPALAFAAATTCLVVLDPHDTPYFSRTDSFYGFNRTFSSRNTSLAMFLLPASFYAVGAARKDSYAKQTALLAGQAVLNGQILSLGLKAMNRRVRPRDIPAGGDFSHTWFKSEGGVISRRHSFPSGHSIMAFSLATVFAHRYPHRRWVPWVAYGLAGVVAFSRVSTRSHFPSDAFAGAIIGYTMTRFVVLRQPPE